MIHTLNISVCLSEPAFSLGKSPRRSRDPTYWFCPSPPPPPPQPCVQRGYLSPGQTPASLTLMFVFLASSDINTSLSHPDIQTGSYPLRCLSFRFLCEPGFDNVHEDCREFSSVCISSPPPPLPPPAPGPSPPSSTCQTGSLSLSFPLQRSSLLRFLLLDQVVFCYQSRNQTPL